MINSYTIKKLVQFYMSSVIIFTSNKVHVNCKCNTFYAQDQSESEYYTSTILNTTQGLYSRLSKPCDCGS